MQRRNTHQRKVIYEIVKNTDIHPTADWVYEKARAIIPNISLGTVYRNLKLLTEEGYLIELEDGKQSRFDAKLEKHFHLKCSICGNIYDIDYDKLNLTIYDESFIVQNVKVMIEGICHKCTVRGKSEKDS